MSKYRMYVDEVGNPGLRTSTDPRHRYLSLTGIIMDLDYVRDVVHPTLESLKRKYFDSHPDDPVILHRKEILEGKHPFEPLRDATIRATFDSELLSLLEELDYLVVTAVIDKAEHLSRYPTWHFHPYHYCLTVLVERFVLWLRSNGLRGDVMAESRGGKEDRKLKDSYERLISRGNQFIPAARFQEHLTTKQLKVRPKPANVAGLQLADLLAHPSYKATRLRQQKKGLPSNFGGSIGKLLESQKYLRSPDGKIWGWGRKWLP